MHQLPRLDDLSVVEEPGQAIKDQQLPLLLEW